ncbi:hypothetical protein PR202_gb18199 [Eleusine coracana subsp. coracana]|uniref:WAT1-related protein n=1 Tax=Eleusine coracana subsp. coracana TaxID=191504 RepID=A0AAV5F5M3_ELECO|nr:hypothetical protein QOZ80_6BG0457980 [Eleusine coracana subsp. coracana]GJN29933.1 hypothetical protein PR202_gb18199 [Eleusine coracana subsp. coracana]
MADQPRKSWDDAPAPEVDYDHVVAVKPQMTMAATTALEATALALSMVLVQAFTMVMLVLSKLALNTGMRPFVLLVYRNLIAAAVVAPLAIIFERKTWKMVNLAVFGWISVNATFGVVLAMGLYYYGLQATSPSYSVNFLNLIPIVTFAIAIILRLEKLALGKWPGKMKVVGAVMCVAGTMMVSLLKSRLLHLWPTHLLRYSHAQHHHHAQAAASSHHQQGAGMVRGTFFLCGSCLSYAMWFIVQARVAKVFPSRYWATMLTCLFGSVQSFLVGIILGHGKADWRLKWDLQLLTVVYSGVFNTGITFVLISWAISRRGPIYPPMFNSLSLIITTIMDSLLLGTNIYLGSVAGSLLIIIGLYAFLWGKGKELQLTAKKQPPQGGDDEHEMA